MINLAKELSRLLAALSILSVAITFSWAEERQLVSGLPLSIILPDELKQGDYGLGVFANDSLSAFLEIRLLAIDEYKYFISDLGKKELGTVINKNGEALKSEEIILSGQKYTILSGKRAVGDRIAKFWSVFVGQYPSYSLSFLQVDNGPESILLDRESVIEVLTSLRMEEPLPFAEQLLLVGVKIVPEEPFVHNQVVNSQAVFLSATDQSYRRGGEELSITLVAPLQWNRQHTLGELERYGIQEVRDFVREEVPFAGAVGSRIAGIVDDSKGGGTWTTIQYLAVSNDRLIVFTAKGRSEEMTPELTAVIDRMAMSVALVE